MDNRDFTEQGYRTQLSLKEEQTRAQFARFDAQGIEVYSSQIKHYRMRAEFRVWHDHGDLYYVMFDPQTKKRYRVDQFPAAAEIINRWMPEVIKALKQSELLKKKIFQIDFLSSLSGELVVSLLYHKELCQRWEGEICELRELLRERGANLHFIGRARKQKKVFERDYVVEQLEVNGSLFTYQQVENSFTQPNGRVAEKMLEWASNQSGDPQSDLLELYCGNGNFSIALAQNFRKVLATELAKSSVVSAQWNREQNGIKNLKIARLSAEELSQAISGQRVFKRLQQQEIELGEYQFSTVLVDPPRAGVDPDSIEMIRAFDTILYFSCNPDTLEVNLDQLKETHQLEKIALFDQFPYTPHREIGVLLKRK